MNVLIETEFHTHCESCVKISKCTKKVVQGESCTIISCKRKCGASFHHCKAVEHNLLCPNVKEPCINAGYGCPHVLFRKFRGSHLESCPASCLPCNAEWNRWPLCSKERQDHIPFAQINPQLREEQLDVALALRDQEVLNHWMTLPRKIQKLMRCHLTPRHPTIPLVSSLWDPSFKKKLKSISSEDGLSNASMEGTPRQSVERTSDHSILSVSSTDDESPWGRRRKPPGLLQSVCTQLFNKSAAQKQQILPTPFHDDNCNITNQVLVMDEDTLSDISNGLDDSSSELVDAAFSCPGLLPANPPELPLLITLGLDLSIECFPRDQSKPKSMYTFVCAQDFRRDEFAWHYRNWHSDIHGGLDGWMEQRCPLARYGCSYATRRMNPAGPDYRVIYSSIVQSFGVTMKSQSIEDPGNFNGELILTDLPFEILRNIARYLDSFSLCHLSLTCQLLRDVARSLLFNRGLVTAYWQKSQQGWNITHHRWSFSTAFSPVERWRFESSSHLSNHLKECRYNIKSNVVFPERVGLPYIAGIPNTFNLFTNILKSIVIERVRHSI